MAMTESKVEETSAAPAKRPGRQWNPLASRDAVNAEIDRLGLGKHVVELDQQGFTIIPPDKIGEPTNARVLEAVIRIAEEASGVKVDLETGSSVGQGNRPDGSLFPWQDDYGDLLTKDPVFQELVLNEPILAMVTYLLGEHAELSNTLGAWFRGPSDAPAGFVTPSLHSDNYGVPSPFPPYAQVCNATLALTEYSREGGCLGFIPGSHKLMRHPLATNEFLDQWVPAECPAGSVIFWHGNTWHTIGNPRTIPGIRISLALVFCRPHMLPISPQKGVTQEMVDRNGPRFARLVGLHNRYKHVAGAYENATAADGIPGAPSVWE